MNIGDQKKLTALRAVNLDWVSRIDSVWRSSPHDVPQLYEKLQREVQEKMAQLRTDTAAPSPLGWLILGEPGAGKTHLLGSIRRSYSKQAGVFVLVDMTDVRHFWETALLGFVTSLTTAFEDGEMQLSKIVPHLVKYHVPPNKVPAITRKLGSASMRAIGKLIDKILDSLYQHDRVHTQRFEEVVRAVLLLHSNDRTTASIGFSWLQGREIEADDAHTAKLSPNPPKHSEIFSGLSWIANFAGPSIIALDQFDAIVAQHQVASAHLQESAEEMTEEQRIATSIIHDIANGLSALKDCAFRSLVVATCLKSTSEILMDNSVSSNADRFEPARVLMPAIATSGEIAKEIVRVRLAQAFERVSFSPSYPTWPFKPESFSTLKGKSPRAILKLCDDHINLCIRDGRVTEKDSFDSRIAPPPPETNGFDEIDTRFEELAKQQGLLTEDNEDEAGLLLQNLLRYLILENPIEEDVDIALDTEFGGGVFPPLHARLRLIHRLKNDREEHFSLRVLEKENANAFRSRLSASLTAAGIDKKITFRHLVIFRNATSEYRGTATKEVVERFEEAGGRFIKLPPGEIGALGALVELEKNGPRKFKAWLKARKPASQLACVKEAFSQLIR